MSVSLQTNYGDIKIEVFCDSCPVSAKNFLALCASGYYNNTLFHRNIKGFMIQGGDPTATGEGGKSIFDKNFDDEISDSIKHDRKGMVAWANSGPNSNNSQFYIIYDAAPHLDNTATIFGKVIFGFDVLDKIENAKVGAKYKPIDQIKILNVKIHANPIASDEINFL
ncbi:hypothetical protein MHBO_001155 [Bonamia ostreae]|uniref:Peptidyl-prolyl cis-trans isomerase n=1 Tax=Bonamia ostreae TaxID=126728 RepID=A0ABV2AI03_9EUKA